MTAPATRETLRLAGGGENDDNTVTAVFMGKIVGAIAAKRKYPDL
jgi:hypothetical protein